MQDCVAEHYLNAENKIATSLIKAQYALKIAEAEAEFESFLRHCIKKDDNGRHWT